jgi:hypothetical protein
MAGRSPFRFSPSTTPNVVARGAFDGAPGEVDLL